MDPAPPPLPPEAPISTPPVKKKSIFHTLAAFCILSPLIAIGFDLVAMNQIENVMPTRTREDALVKAILSGIIPTLGILAGLVSLCGIPRHGARGILWKALLGIIIWVVLFWSAFATFQRIQEIARKRQAQQQAHGAQ